MNKTKTHIKNQTKIKTLDLGKRSVSKQNFSWILTLPHTFVENFLKETKEVSLCLEPDGRLVLTPARMTKKEVKKNE